MDELNLTQAFNGNLTSGGITNPYWDSGFYQPLVEHYYYPFYGYWQSEDQTKKAFNLIQTLMKKKIIAEPKTVKDFIEIVNVIVEIL